MIGLALSGGGSRAVAFHLGCLRALNDFGLLQRINVLSTISGGSLVGAYWAYTPDKDFEKFDADICALLRRGLHRRIALQMAKPSHVLRTSASVISRAIGALLNGTSVRGQGRFDTRTDAFREVLRDEIFGTMRMSSPRRSNMDVVIGACELGEASAFRFGNKVSGAWRYGEMIEGDVEVAFAVAASAAYPILLPAVDRAFQFRREGREFQQRVAITDGGVYDNLGLQVLEPGRDPAYSLHTFACDYLIVCNAGPGAASIPSLPLGFLPRVERSFDIVHRRVQDASMERLHRLKRSGAIKGFAMPYLGQRDDALPWKPANLVRRPDVISYPTNFAAMNDAWIDKLSLRGEQLTRTLVDFYLSAIL